MHFIPMMAKFSTYAKMAEHQPITNGNAQHFAYVGGMNLSLAHVIFLYYQCQ